MKTKCYENKRNTIGVLLEWILTTRTAATTPRISIFTLSLLKIRPVFLMFPNVCLLISQRWEKISTNGFHHCKLPLKESLSLQNEQNRTNLNYWKIVVNEKCTAEMAKLSTVKNLFWANQASKKAHISLKQKVFEWTKVPENLNCFYSVIIENWGRNRQKNAQNSPKSSKIAVFRLLVNK